jgi:Glycosyl transferase family 2
MVGCDSGTMKLASVVVPLESSRQTVRATVDALLAQSYCGIVEIILVGERDDPAWTSIWREIDTGQVQVIEVEGGDVAHRRAVGVEAASGDVLCVLSDGALPPRDWVARQVARSLVPPSMAERTGVMHTAYHAA